MQATKNCQQKRESVRTRFGTQRGVSLIEVLIVLVILVVGISTIIRLFPSGFFSIESVSTAAVADSLGQALIEAQRQNSTGLPDEILPGTLSAGQPSATATMAAYDPDVPDNLDYAKLIHNETITIPVPTTINGPRQSLYAVNYGPMIMGVDPAATNLTTLPNSLAINSLPWQIKTGDSTNTANRPQDDVTPGQPVFVVDYTHKMIAVPYAPYATDASGNTKSYNQTMVLMIIGSDGKTYTEYLNVPAAAPRDSNNPEAPLMPDKRAYLADTTGSNAVYQGGWFDPTTTYADAAANSQTAVPANVSWSRVVLTRAFQGIPNTGTFSTANPYEFMLPNANFGSNPAANLGVIAFNPLGAGGSGLPALKAQISYQTYSWQIIHEDRDIPALSNGSQDIVRLTLKQLKRNGDSYTDTAPDGSLAASQYKGLAGSGFDVKILDLDTGKEVGGTLVDEDNSGTSGTAISVGHSVGRLVVPGGSLGDNLAHRVRIFYQCIGDWTAAIQKAPSSYAKLANTVTGTGTDPVIGPAQFAFDPAGNIAYFPLSEAGRSVEFDGTYVLNGATSSFSETASIDPARYQLGSTPYLRVDLTDPLRLASPVPAGATVTFTAVRGLSSRAVVAWKENKHWKVHTVDTVLARSQ